MDEETGLYYYRSRYYDPAVGRFINEDTIGFNGGDTNLYRYVSNSPLNYTDPFGYFTNGGVQVPTQAPPGTGTTVSPSGTVPTIGVPTINKRDLYILTPQEQRRKAEFIKEFGNFPGSDNPNLWRVDPERLPKPYRQPTCITVPGSTCTPPEPESPEEWAERMRELFEEINKENQEKEEENSNNDSGDSCQAPWASNENQPPEASNQNNDDDGQSDDSNDRGEGDANETQQNENDLVFRVPDSRRHRISKVKQGGVKKDKNTVVPDYVDFNADISAINEGRAIRNQDDTFTVNDRTYGYHPETGKTYPISGKDFYELDRGAYEALGIYNKFGNTSRANDILDNIGVDEASRRSALEAQNANQ